MKLLIAREAVDEHLSVAGALVDPDVKASDKAASAARAARFYAKWLPQLVTGPGQRSSGFEDFDPTLAPHLRFVERSSRKLARSTFYAMARWQGRLERKQGFLGRIVDIGAELYAMSAACVRAKMLVESGRDEGVGAVELADLFCQGARRRVDRHLHDLWRNDDDANYQAAQKVLDGRYAWAEDGILDPAMLAVQLATPAGVAAP
jgi:hypothetical protein